MMKYTICAIAVLMLFPASAFAMENDGDQKRPCKNMDLAERMECRVGMLEHRIDTVNSKGCQSLTVKECEIAESIYVEQLALIEKVKDAIESFPDLTPKERKALIHEEISEYIMTMHENCDIVENMRQS